MTKKFRASFATALAVSSFAASGLCGVTAGALQPNETSQPAILTFNQEQQDAFNALMKMRSARTLPEIADALTNRSAAQVGIIESLGFEFIVGFQGIGSSKSASSTFTNDLAAYLKGYNLTDKSMPGNDLSHLPPAFVARGREFLTGLAPFSARVDKMSSGSSDLPPVSTLPSVPAGYRMLVNDPNNVTITLLKPIGEMPSTLYARNEDGAWRIDMRDIGKMAGVSSSNQQQSPNHPQTAGADAAKLFDAVKNGDADAVSAILRRKPALIEARDDQGDTPIIAECFWGSIDVVRVLVVHGAAVNAVDNTGTTALMQAATFDKADIVRYLIAHGAKINAKDDFGKTALDNAKDQKLPDMVAFLKMHGAE